MRHAPTDRKQARLRGRRWMAIRSFVLTQQPLCFVCLEQGVVTPTDEVDHIIPLEQGGTDDPENLQALCHACHLAKTLNKKTTGIDGWPIATHGGA